MNRDLWKTRVKTLMGESVYSNNIVGYINSGGNTFSFSIQEAGAARSRTEADQKELEDALGLLSGRAEVARIRKQNDLGYLLGRVCGPAAERLLKDESFVRWFEESKKWNAFVLSIDMRRSADLMLRGKTPQLYADFLNHLSRQLVAIIKENYGVVDKFTGDGLLACFPEFFAGPDAGYRALSAAKACHSIFAKVYREARSSFNITLKDIGFGIGMDFGEVHVLRITDELTVVGPPVVYARRLSGAPAGHTYMNHAALAQLAVRCPKEVHATEVDFAVKYEGTIICLDVTLADICYDPAPPGWLADVNEAQRVSLFAES